jgi:outer membrane protein assembly factor BamB
VRPLLLLVLAGCGASGHMGLSAPDNDPASLRQALSAARPTGKPGQPRNATGRPLVFYVAAGKIGAWDLAAGKDLWTQSATPDGRFVVGNRLVVAREKGQLVARDVATGRVAWQHPLPKAKLVGVAADGDRFFYVAGDEAVAVDAGGQVAWRLRGDGELGAPAAAEGLVFIPHLHQWLSLLDAGTGKPYTRLRCLEEKVSFVRAGEDGVVYGSRGAFLLDEKAALGSHAGATYGRPALPEFAKPLLGQDAYLVSGAAYSALDRVRVLWRAQPTPAGQPLTFTHGGLVVLHFKYFIALDEAGTVRWAVREIRDVAAAEQQGDAIVFLTTGGELAALDVATGARVALGSVGKRAVGATIDAAGWKLPAAEPPLSAAQGLLAVVRDRDARFAAVKRWAAAALGTLPADAPGLTAALVEVVRDPQASPDVVTAAGSSLAQRIRPDEVKLLVPGLSVRADFVAGVKPRGIGALAGAAATNRSRELVPLLVAHLTDPATPEPELAALAAALGEIGDPAAFRPLANLLLLHRADPAHALEAGPWKTVALAVGDVGGAEGRAFLAHVAADPRTVAAVADAARNALAQTRERGTLVERR